MKPFEPRGDISLREACTTIIVGLSGDEGIAYAAALAEIEDAVGYPVDLRLAQSAMRLASEALIRSGELGVRTVASYGWVRMDARRALGHADERVRRARRQAVRAVSSAKVADPEALDWAERQRRDRIIGTQGEIAALMARRAERAKVVPPS